MRRLHRIKIKWLPYTLAKQILFASILVTSGLLLILTACSSQPEVVTVEVTRVVTETVVIEGEPIEVEVTRIVTETVIETVEVEGEAVEEPPSATGSEDDSGPLPPDPDNGPKVVSRNGESTFSEVAWETAVPLRSNPHARESNPVTVVAFTNLADPVVQQKLCRFIGEVSKKRCK